MLKKMFGESKWGNHTKRDDDSSFLDMTLKTGKKGNT